MYENIEIDQAGTLESNIKFKKHPLNRQGGIFSSRICVFLCRHNPMENHQNQALKSRPVNPARPPGVPTGRDPQSMGMCAGDRPKESFSGDRHGAPET